MACMGDEMSDEDFIIFCDEGQERLRKEIEKHKEDIERCELQLRVFAGWKWKAKERLKEAKR